MTLIQTKISFLLRTTAPAVFAATMLGAISSAQALAETPVQIIISQAQIARAGIQTQIAIAAPANSTVPAGAASSATGSATGSTINSAIGQQLSGTVVAPTSAINVVSSMVSGVIQKIHVDTLQTVQPGSQVVTLFSQQLMEMQREYLQLASQARLSKEKHERDEALFKEGIIALGRVQESRAAAMQTEVAASERYQALRAAGISSTQLRSILTSHALSPYLTLNAGVRGTILELTLTNGQRIEAGMPIAKISQASALWIEFQASRQQAEHIRLGDPLYIKGCNDSSASATVIAISPQMNGSNQSTLIRARQSEQSKASGCLRLNQFVEASHRSGTPTAGSVGVAASAIVRNGAKTFVFVKNGQGFEAVRVQVQPGSADKVWVSGSLKAGTQVAVKGIIAIKGAWIGLGAEGADTAVQPVASEAAKNPVRTNVSATAKDAAMNAKQDGAR
jgi:multidrug resistance efflux pump